jgi:hypothetical protein
MNNTSDDDIECVYESKKELNDDQDSNLVNSDSSFNDSRNNDNISDENNEAEADEEEAPNGAECLNRCKEFAEITGTDRALAMFYLQDNNWNLQVLI